MNERDLNRVFDQNAIIAANLIQGQEIVDMATGSRVRLDEVQGYQQVGKQYGGIADIPSGYLWTPRRRTTQALVVLRPEFKPGSCVRIVRSSYYDIERREYVFEDVERSTAEHLNMRPDEIAKLQYHPETGIFHLIKGHIIRTQEQGVNQISPEEADRDLSRLFSPQH